MIANFYRTPGHNIRNAILLVSKNIDSIPQKKTLIKLSGQTFIVDDIVFNVDNCEYNIYMYRV